MRIVSLIPARGGSKGIPGKNLVSLAGKPLIAWTIEASKKSSLISDTFVISDDKKIRDLAEKYGSKTIALPERLAQDQSPMLPVVVYALKHLSKAKPDYLVLLQPTSPLRTTGDINRAIKLLIKRRASALISVTTGDSHILKSFITLNDGFLHGICNDTYPFTPRRLLPAVYCSNGAIYIISIKAFLKKPGFLLNKTVPYLMPHERSADIDTLENLLQAQRYIEKHEIRS